MLPRERRLTDSKDYGQVFRRGKGCGDKLLVVKILRIPGEERRAGVSVSKRLGGAVTRNRIKRRLREALRFYLPRIPSGVHLVVVAKPGSERTEFAVLRNSLGSLLERLGLLC